MRVRCLSEPFAGMYGARFFPACLAEDGFYQLVLPLMGRQVLEINVDGVPVQHPPPFPIEVVEATPEEWAGLREAGYELHGLPSA